MWSGPECETKNSYSDNKTLRKWDRFKDSLDYFTLLKSYHDYDGIVYDDCHIEFVVFTQDSQNLLPSVLT